MIERGGVGENEAERLLNTERLINRIIQNAKQLRDVDGRILNEQERSLIVLTAISEARSVDMRKASLLAKLETDRTNAIKEQQKEFAKSMMMAGPAELLRKTAVMQLAQKSGGRLSLGQLFAMSPDARRDAAMLSPATADPRIAEMSRQITDLRATLPTLRQTQNQWVMDSRFTGALAASLATVLGRSGGGQPDVISPGAVAAAQSLTAVNSAAAAAAQALGLIPKTVADIADSYIASRMSSRGPATKGAAPHPLDDSAFGPYPVNYTVGDGSVRMGYGVGTTW